MQYIEHNGKTFRVLRRIFQEYEHGYLEPTNNHYNILQEQYRFLGIKLWHEVERERIPAFAWIQKATLGSTDWQSTLLQKINNKTHPIFMS